MNEIFKTDKEVLGLLEKIYKDYPTCAFSSLKNKSIIASLNHNQAFYSNDGEIFLNYIKNGKFNTRKINRDYNWNYLITANINGKKEYVIPAEYFKKLLTERYNK